jgi:bifunctional DNA-binding transcriptional regulator/antitoxin component of YhaV-PrlF toxin-antitoxin module
MTGHNINIDKKGRVIMYIPARDRDDLKLKDGDTFRTKVDKKRRRLIICFEQEEK